jgi:hypothetical protein
MLDAFHHAVGKLQDALYRSDLETALSGVQDGFTCLHKPGPWQQASGWMDGNRTYLFSRTLDVAPTDFSGGGD